MRSGRRLTREVRRVEHAEARAHRVAQGVLDVDGNEKHDRERQRPARARDVGVGLVAAARRWLRGGGCDARAARAHQEIMVVTSTCTGTRLSE